MGAFFFPESQRWKDAHSPQETVRLLDYPGEESASSSSTENTSSPSSTTTTTNTSSGNWLNRVKELLRVVVSLYKPFFIGLILSVAQQITGINAVIMYSPSIVEAVGLTSMRQKLLATIGVGAWNFVTTLLALFLV